MFIGRRWYIWKLRAEKFSFKIGIFDPKSFMVLFLWNTDELIMEPHGQSPWYLHEIPSYAKASEGYPPVAKSAEALILRRMNDPTKVYAFIHGQSP
jgi:hypothetical protein